jgi:predicted nucleic acid-binding protein
MYLLGKVGGYPYQATLWQLRAEGHLVLHDLSSDEVNRAELLMEKYHDAPMDLADASLVAAAEKLDLRRVFSLDHHFRFYRLLDGSVLEMVPR